MKVFRLVLPAIAALIASQAAALPEVGYTTGGEGAAETFDAAQYPPHFFDGYVVLPSYAKQSLEAASGARVARGDKPSMDAAQIPLNDSNQFERRYFSNFRVREGTITINTSNDGKNARRGILVLATVPEPSTWAMLLVGVGLAGFALRRRRRSGVRQPA